MRRLSLVCLSLLLFGLAGLAAWAGPKTAPSARPPNVLLILADDLGWGDVGFNGRKAWKTPHLDRLARQGTVFRRWYAGAVVCDPSRALLLTGKYSIHNGVVANTDDLPDAQVTLAEALKSRGYRTGLFGKWHHGAPRPGKSSYVHPMDQGFDEFFGYTDAREAWEKFPKKLWDGREERPVSGYADTLFTDRALDFLRRQRDKPFFLYVPYIATHLRIQAPEEDVARLQGRFPETDSDHPVRAAYAAMAERLDAEIGRLLSAVDELGLRENTLVLFSSDQGATFEVGNEGASAFHDSNHPFRGGKRTLWEGGIRVPGVVRWPGHVPSGRVSGEIFHDVDLMPTVLAAVGGQPDPGWRVDGMSLLPVWTGTGKAPERTLFWEWRQQGSTQLAAMRGDMKLVLTGKEPPELFDVVNDPGERRSRAAEFPALVKELRQEVTAWMATETEEAKWGKSQAGKAE